MKVALDADSIRVGDYFHLTLQRTLRIPDDGRVYPLPPGLGRLPVHRCTSYPGRLPSTWLGENCFFTPMYQREALWLGFRADWPPVAVKVEIGGVNAISGRHNEGGLHSEPQDYVVCPEQLWLDGIKTGAARIRQFVAVSLGERLSVEASITGREDIGGFQVEVFEPKDETALKRPHPAPDVVPARQIGRSAAMGLGAGGQMTQKIYPDPHGIAVWHETPCARILIHIVNSMQFREITGSNPPPTPIDARMYTERGYPWFELYDEHMGDVAAPDELKNVRTVAEGDRGLPADAHLDIDSTQVHPARGLHE
jgi:hypothetical protein